MFAAKSSFVCPNQFQKAILGLVAFLLLTATLQFLYNAENSLIQNKYSQVPSIASKAVSLSPEEQRVLIEKRKNDVFTFNSVEEAEKVVSFKVRAPEHPALKNLSLQVHVTRDKNPDEREAYLYYGDLSNPIVVLERKANIPVDYQTLYKEMLEWKEKGYTKNDANPELININGSTGIAVQPGYNFVDGKEIPRPGWVDFTKDGVQFVVLGKAGDSATSLKELIEIAESL